jgi:hypothetical protein
MKDIKDMNLAECINRLRELPDGTIEDQFDMRDLPWIFDVAEELADRIHELTRWIREDEQYPEEGETVLCWRVETTMAGTKATKPKVGTFRNGRFDCEMDWIRVSKWQRITPPEGV